MGEDLGPKETLFIKPIRKPGLTMHNSSLIHKQWRTKQKNNTCKTHDKVFMIKIGKNAFWKLSQI